MLVSLAAGISGEGESEACPVLQRGRHRSSQHRPCESRAPFPACSRRGSSNEKIKALSRGLTEALTILCVKTDDVTCHERYFPEASFTLTRPDLKVLYLLLHPGVWEQTACSIAVLVGQRNFKPYTWQASFLNEIYLYICHIYVLYIIQKYIFHFNICLNLYLFIILPSKGEGNITKIERSYQYFC